MDVNELDMSSIVCLAPCILKIGDAGGGGGGGGVSGIVSSDLWTRLSC